MILSRLTGLLVASTVLLPVAASSQEPASTPPPAIQAEPAANGTPEGAEEIRRALEAYLTATPFERGILAVAPDAEGQRITLTLAPFLTEMAGSEVTFAPMSFVVSEREDGNWNVFSDDAIEIAGTFEMEGEERTEEYRQEWQVMKGVFSPELGTFLSFEGESGPTTQVGRDAVSTAITGSRHSRIEGTATPVGDGAADIAFQQSYEGYTQTLAVDIPLDESEPSETLGFTFDASVAEVVTEGTAGAVRSRAMLDLYALVLSHADALAADPKATLAGPAGEEMKRAVEAVLPLWNNFDMTAEASDFGIETLYGNVVIERLSQAFRMSGIAENSFLETTLAMSGMRADSPMLPEWVLPLVPHLVEFEVAVADVDLATPVEIALREADLATDEIWDQPTIDEMLAAFDPESITARLGEGRIEADLFDLTFEGDFAMEETGPGARIDIEMGGLDETIAALQAAAPEAPELNDGIGLLQMAKGFSRPGPDGRAQWNIEAFPDGSVQLNGTMLKGPDPVDDGLDENLDGGLDEPSADEPTDGEDAL